MKNNPLATVLMPVYNAENYLKESIESILNQTYSDFVFLIINDCSTDKSLEIIQSFDDPRIKIYSNPTNLGQTKSLNVGLKLIDTKYVIINDADDLSLPQRIEKQIQCILKYPESSVIGAFSHIMDQDGKIYRTYKKPIGYNEIYKMAICDTPTIHGSVIMNTQAILEVGGYNDDYVLAQDWELWSRLLYKGHIITNMPEYLVVIRLYMSSMSFTSYDDQTRESASIIQYNVTKFTHVNITYEQAKSLRLLIFKTTTLNENHFSDTVEIVNKLYKNIKNTNITYSDKFVGIILFKPYFKYCLHLYKKLNFNELRKHAKNYTTIYKFNIFIYSLYVLSFGGRFASIFFIKLIEIVLAKRLKINI